MPSAFCSRFSHLAAAVMVTGVVLGALAQPASSADWSAFRGANSSAVSPDTGLPIVWSDSDHLQWKVVLPGKGSSCPIIVGDKVFVTCYTGYGESAEAPGKPDDLKRWLLCYSAADGKPVWQTPLQSKHLDAEYEGFIQEHGYASSTPVCDGSNVYVFWGSDGVAAYDLKGEILWQSPVGSKKDKWGSASSPILHDDLVIVNSAIEDGALIAFNKADGKEKWRFTKITGRSWSTPAVVPTGDGKSAELVLSIEGKIVGLNPASGEELWSCDGVSGYTCPGIVPGDGVVYVTGGRRSETFAVKLGGRGDVTQTHLVWKIAKGNNVTTPLLYEGKLFSVNDRGIALCFDPKDGKVLYEQRLGSSEKSTASNAESGAADTVPVSFQPPADGKEPPPPPGRRRRGMGGPPGGGGFGRGGGPGGGGGFSLYASPVAADGKIFAVTRDAGTFVIAAKPEFSVLSVNKLTDAGRFDSTPAIANGRLFIRSTTTLYCVGNK